MEKRDWLIKKRREKNFTQAELAKLVNVSNKTISKIELGERNPSGELALRIARVLNFDMKLFYDSQVIVIA